MHFYKRTVTGLFLGMLALMAAAPLAPTHVVAATADTGTANDFSMYVPYTGIYDYGSNMGYYGTQFKDQDVAQLAWNAGSHTVRPSLPDWLITGYGVDSRITSFQAYQQIGMRDLTAFVGEPNDPAVNGTSGPDDRETMVFPGADEAAHTFKGMYEPIWLDAAKTQINPANTYANYIYKTVKEYGPYVKFWEIVNEPDFTYGSNGWADPSSPTSWWNVNPSPDELGNLKAPIFYYVRELRVAYDVIKTLQPNEYVATGGIGYASFLDAVLRNTDNPVDGSVTAQYPLKGGAYFDVLSYHVYPMYDMRHWDNVNEQFVYTRYSDSALDSYLQAKTDFQTVLTKYGYNGSTYPNKQWIVTETDLPQATVDGQWGTADSARNYIVKAHILGQANGILQMYKYGLGESDDNSNPEFNVMGVYGDLSPATTTVANAPKTDEFKAVKTLSDALYGKTYDASRTAQLNLPATIRGVAFKDASGNYTYALWAVTSVDESEAASATYTFPFAFSGTRRDWDYSSTGISPAVGQTVSLTGSPSYFLANAGTATTGTTGTTTTTYVPPFTPIQPIPPIVLNAPVVSAGPDVTVALGTASSPTALLVGSGRGVNAYIARFAWTQVAGPSQAVISTPTASSTNIVAPAAGSYVFRLTATDANGLSASDDVTVTVTGAQPASSSFTRVTVTARSLNVRATPAGTILSRMPYGHKGLVTAQSAVNGTTWDQVLYDTGVSGWSSSLYLQTW